MKNKSGIILISCLTAVALMTSTMAFGKTTLTTNLTIEKTVYLMDPYHWVYTAALATDPAGEYWPVAGHDREVNFEAKFFDEAGVPFTFGISVYFQVRDGDVLIANGPLAPTATPGSYTGSFYLTEADLGGAGFSGQVPKELALTIRTTYSVWVDGYPITVGRWGCDRCHVEKSKAMELYAWSSPTGGPLGPHSWRNILGSAGFPFTIDYLTDAEYTHTPPTTPEPGALFAAGDNHERTYRKSDLYLCSPCHNGYGPLRPYINQSKSQTVQCTFCHGIEGGYVPAVGKWMDNAGYISASHRHEDVPIAAPSSPYLAWQTCSNSGCHGHIKDDEAGEILHDKPDCRDCHGIHNDDF
jgi:hypothetical protein